MVIALQLAFLICSGFAGYSDYKSRTVPLKYTAAMTLIGIALICLVKDSTYKLLGVIPAVLIYFILWHTGGKIGGGDVKMIFALGIFHGLADLIYVMIIACLAAIVASLITNRGLLKAGADKMGSDTRDSINAVKRKIREEKSGSKTLEEIEAEVEAEVSAPIRQTSIPFCSWLSISSAAWCAIGLLVIVLRGQPV